MAQDESAILIIGLTVVVALFGIGLTASSLATHQSFGGMMSGGMMGSSTTTDPGPGSLEWGILVASAALFLGAVFVYYRSRSAGKDRGDEAMRSAASEIIPPTPTAAPAAAREEPVPEPTLVRLLGEDERRMYLEIREHGGEMLQRDLVALGTFSKAKVTRVLDKLETKGLVVRERHGMTNRVRLMTRASK